MRKPTNLQRLVREKTLHRYLLAVASVDLAAIEQIWQQATHDELLEYMLLEAHEVYLEQETSTLQEEIPMDFKEGVHKSLPQEELDELQAAQDAPTPQPSRYARWLQVLAAIVLIALLSGGVLLYTRVHPIASTAHKQIYSSISVQVSYTWCIASGPASDHPTLIPALASVAAIAPDNVWAVGNESSRGSIYNYPSVPLIEHWDGTQWSIVPGADLTTLYNSLAQRLTGVSQSKITEVAGLTRVAALSANDIWAFGYISANGPSSLVSQTLVERWNGQQWQLLAGPDAVPPLVVLGDNDMWGLKQLQPTSNSVPPPLVEHWDGNSWNNVPLPASLNINNLTLITATSPDSVWAAGLSTSQQGESFLVVHWDGRHWRALPAPNIAVDSNPLAMASDAAGDIWITGEVRQLDQSNQPFVAYWNGKQWSILKGLQDIQAGNDNIQNQGMYAHFSVIAVNNPHDVWVAGQNSAGNTLTEHWNGQSWSIASQAMPSPGEINDMALSGNKLWLVGDRYDNHAQTSKGALIATSC